MDKLSLVAEAREQLKKARTGDADRAARTVYGGHDHALRQTVIALTAGASLAEHANPGEATLQVLDGRVRLSTATTHWDGRSGDLIVIPREKHSLEALEDACVLLTVVKTGNGVVPT